MRIAVPATFPPATTSHRRAATARSAELAQTFRALRGDLGLSILLIEHDVGLVMALCDYVSVLDQGLPIAEGTPTQVRNNPAVVSAYLGETPPPRLASLPLWASAPLGVRIPRVLARESFHERAFTRPDQRRCMTP